MQLIKSIRAEFKKTRVLIENVGATPFEMELIAEAADKYIGAAIGALKNGKNPFETMPGSEEVLAGLMLLANDDNRDALNVTPKKFDLVAQKANDSRAIQKYVAQFAQSSGQSLIKNLPQYVQDQDKRDVLAKKLVKLQNVYSQARLKAKTGDELKQAV